MNPNIVLTKLTAMQRQAWILRNVHNWSLRRIALRLGSTTASVGNILRRADHRIADIVPRRVRMRRRLARATSLSSVFEY